MLVVCRKKPMSVTTADGSPMKGAGEYYTTPYCMKIGSHQEDISWEVAQLEENIAGYLPMSWLYLHNPDIEWNTGIIRWQSPYFKKHCLPMTSPKEVMDYVQGILVTGPDTQGPRTMDSSLITNSNFPIRTKISISNPIAGQKYSKTCASIEGETLALVKLSF
jgi:hypothetical protein